MSHDEILISALMRWGEDAQKNMAIEECAELIVALIHDFRGRETDGGRLDHLAEEIADVTIMMRQMRFLVGPELVDRWVDTKMQRLEKRVNDLSRTIVG